MPYFRIAANLAIDEALLEEQFAPASGPGGQNVNKVSTSVQLRFRLSRDNHLPEDLKIRLRRLAGQRLTGEGDILIRAQRFRTRERNREDARARLASLIRQAALRPKARRATKPSKAARADRMDKKTKHGRTKSLRRRPDLDG